MDLKPIIQRSIEHHIMSDTSVEEIIINGYKLEFILSAVKKMSTSSVKGYKYNMLRSKSKKMHQQILDKYYPIKQFPEKHI